MCRLLAAFFLSLDGVCITKRSLINTSDLGCTFGLCASNLVRPEHGAQLSKRLGDGSGGWDSSISFSLRWRSEANNVRGLIPCWISVDLSRSLTSVSPFVEWETITCNAGASISWQSSMDQIGRKGQANRMRSINLFLLWCWWRSTCYHWVVWKLVAGGNE